MPSELISGARCLVCDAECVATVKMWKGGRRRVIVEFFHGPGTAPCTRLYSWDEAEKLESERRI